MRVNDKGWLESEKGDQPLVISPTVRFTKLAMKRPKALLWHWTATVSEQADAFVERMKTYDGEKDVAESWHVVIARDGTVYQSVSLLSAAWHVRCSGILGPNYYQNLNKATVSVTLENAGRLRLVEGRFFVHPPWRKKKPKKEVLGEEVAAELVTSTKTGNHYMTYTEAQVLSAIAVLRAIAKKYDIPRKYCTLGHSNFEYPKQEDPGPIWMEELLPRVLEAVFPSEG